MMNNSKVMASASTVTLSKTPFAPVLRSKQSLKPEPSQLSRPTHKRRVYQSSLVAEDPSLMGSPRRASLALPYNSTSGNKMNRDIAHCSKPAIDKTTQKRGAYFADKE